MGKKKQSITPDTYIHDLRHATDWRERQAAAEALAKYGDDESFTALLAALRDDSESGVRISAARAFAKRRDPRATEPLISAFRKAIGCGDAAHSEFDAYVQVLGRLKDTRAVAALIAGLSSDTPEVREKIRDILLNETGQDVIPLLVAALENPDYRILTAAASVLSRRGYKVTEPLLKALASPHPGTRRGAAVALGDLGAKKALQPLAAALEDEDTSVVQAAARALGRLQDQRAYDPLLPLLQSEQVPVRRAAVEALGSIRDPRALGSLIELLGDDTLAEDAGRSIAQFGPAAIEPLITLFRDERENVRESAVRILGQIGMQCVMPLVGCLADPESRVRLAAARTLGLIRYDWIAFKKEELTASIGSLLPVISDKDPEVRKAAFLSLGILGGTLHKAPFDRDHSLAMKVLDTLTGALSDEDVQVRAWAATALGLFGADECAAPLREVLQDRDEQVRKAAADALKRITEQKAGDIVFSRPKTPELYTGYTSPGKTDEAFKDVSGSGFSYRASYDFQPSSPRPRGPPKMSRSPAPAPAAPPSSSQPALTAGKDKPIETAVRAAPPVNPEQRYTNVTFFHDDKKTKLGKGKPLVVDTPYRLEVAIGTEKNGIPSADGTSEPIREPKRDHPVKIFITAESTHFTIEEPVQTLILPPTGNTVDPAWFRVWAVHETTNPEMLSEITLRLYCDFVLLAIITIQAEVIGQSDPPVSRFGLNCPIGKHEQSLGKEYPDWGNIHPRTMNISVKKTGETYLLRFIFFKDEDQKEVRFPAPLRISPLELESLLMRVRTKWTEIAMSETFTRQLECDNYKFQQYVRGLAEEGRHLWTTLFEQDNDSALFNIGEWLMENPLPEDSIIQITCENKETDFLFPWALLYDRELPEERQPVDPQGFWGIRYCIEQRIFGLDCVNDKELTGMLRFAFFLWESFGNAGDQKLLFQNLADNNPGIIEKPVDPITDAKECCTVLKDCTRHILYFYTHGHTRPRETSAGLPPPYQKLMQIYKSFDETDDRKELFKFCFKALENTQYETDSSRIELTSGKVTVDNLKACVKKDFKTNPIVFLNMCESAQIIPTLSESFVYFFLNRGAACVIGTECPMTIQFAHPFSEKFFQGLLRGESVGKAALQASRHFMEGKNDKNVKINNPLGLAYTIYGSVMPTFKPPPIQPPTETG